MSVRNVIRVLTFLGLVGGVPGYALAQEQPGIGVVSTLIGEATVARGTTTQPLDGTMGCPGTGISAEDCFGLQPEFAIRIAVVSTKAGPLLIWLRNGADATADVSAARARLDELLAGMQFADRAAETAAAPAPAADTEYDGEELVEPGASG